MWLSSSVFREREEEDVEFISAACELLSKQTSLKHPSACFCPQTTSDGGEVIAAADEEEEEEEALHADNSV